MHVSIVLNDMHRTHEAVYGFRSWMLQDTDTPYEVILNLFNDQAPLFETLAQGRSPTCQYRIHSYRPPEFFNISAANNLGLAQSTGKYVIFSNSDVIYPSHYLSTLIGELARRNLFYVQGSRVNLLPKVTAALPPASALTNFDSLFDRGGYQGGGNSCWTIRRDIALQLGGFDAKVLCHEDSDLNMRAIHYLCRKGLQSITYSTADLLSFHLHHSASELYTVSQQSRSILEPRRDRLQKDPQSEEDIVATDLGSPDLLLRDLYDTVAPPATVRGKRLGGAIRRRLRGTLRYFLHGEPR